MRKAILFDLDETLLDRSATLENYIESQYSRHELEHIPYEIYRDRFVQLDARGYTDRQQLFENLIGEFALSISTEDLLADFRRNAWKNCKTFADAPEVLRALRLRGYKLGIVTNGSTESQNLKINESGLNLLVDTVLISEREQVKKPDSAIFLRAAERLGAAVSECVFVGDNADTDIVGAYHTGMKTVWYKGSRHWQTNSTVFPDYVISSLRELLSIEF